MARPASTRYPRGSRPVYCASRSEPPAPSSGGSLGTRGTPCTPRNRGGTTWASTASSWLADGSRRSRRRTRPSPGGRATRPTTSCTTRARSRRPWRPSTRMRSCRLTGGGGRPQATRPAEPSGASKGSPADSQASIPPKTLCASNPRACSIIVASSLRLPERQITATGFEGSSAGPLPAMRVFNGMWTAPSTRPASHSFCSRQSTSWMSARWSYTPLTFERSSSMSSQATSDPRSAGRDRFVERAIGLSTEQDEPHLVHPRLGVPHRVQRDGCRLPHGVAVRAGRDRRERHRRRAELIRDAQTREVAPREERRRIAFAPVDRTDGVDHPPGGQLTGRRSDRLTHRQSVRVAFAPELPACVEDRLPALTVDRAVHAAAAEQRRVGGVHDHVGALIGDVTLD